MHKSTLGNFLNQRANFLPGMFPADTDDFRMSLREWNWPIMEIRGIVPFNDLCQQRTIRVLISGQATTLENGIFLPHCSIPESILSLGRVSCVWAARS